MGRAKDSDIWNWALTNGAVTISKDGDFARRSTVAQVGPRIVWLRMGNFRRQALLSWFAIAFPGIVVELQRGEQLIEVRGRP
jgi:predicted nuclease of predicted toxin-antitoxin system